MATLLIFLVIAHPLDLKKIARKIPNGGNTKNVEIVVPLKYLSNFL